MNNYKYLVFQVGCIECSVSSYPIAWCKTKEEAEKIKEKRPSVWTLEGGHGFVKIYEIGYELDGETD